MADFSVSKPLEEVSTFLDNYWNRDKVFRTLQFASMLWAGALEPRLPVASARFAALASSVSSMRTTLRLLDDIPNLVQTLAGWKRPKDSSLILKLVDLLSSLSGLLYYPTEHLAWATDLKLLPFKSSSSLWNFCTVLWITSLVLSCTRSLFTLWATGQEMNYLKKRQQSSSNAGEAEVGPSTAPSNSGGRKRVTFQERSSVNGNGGGARLRVLQGLYRRAALSLVQSLSDLVMAVHFLPRGLLWGGRLSTLLVGLCGTASSLLGLYKILPHNSTRTL